MNKDKLYATAVEIKRIFENAMGDKNLGVIKELDPYIELFKGSFQERSKVSQCFPIYVNLYNLNLDVDRTFIYYPTSNENEGVKYNPECLHLGITIPKTRELMNAIIEEEQRKRGVKGEWKIRNSGEDLNIKVVYTKKGDKAECLQLIFPITKFNFAKELPEKVLSIFKLIPNRHILIVKRQIVISSYSEVKINRDIIETSENELFGSLYDALRELEVSN